MKKLLNITCTVVKWVALLVVGILSPETVSTYLAATDDE